MCRAVVVTRPYMFSSQTHDTYLLTNGNRLANDDQTGHTHVPSLRPPVPSFPAFPLLLLLLR